jgi:CheY-specific phosphatase CheX
MELQEALWRSVQEVFTMINLNPELKQVVEEPSLTSASEVNALVGFNYSIKGNIVFALDKNIARQVTTVMTGVDPGGDDSKVKNAIGDVAKLITDLALGKLKINNSIYFTPPPTLVTGEDVFLLISRTKSKRLLFQINNAEFSIAYSLA